jgi:hypothetical protein
VLDLKCAAVWLISTRQPPRLAGRLLEAHERNYWQPDDAVLDALRDAGEELEDRLEGIGIPANDTITQQTDRRPIARHGGCRMNIVTPPVAGTKTTLLDRSPKGFHRAMRTAKAPSRSSWTRT